MESLLLSDEEEWRELLRYALIHNAKRVAIAHRPVPTGSICWFVNGFGASSDRAFIFDRYDKAALRLRLAAVGLQSRDGSPRIA